MAFIPSMYSLTFRVVILLLALLFLAVAGLIAWHTWETSILVSISLFLPGLFGFVILHRCSLALRDGRSHAEQLDWSETRYRAILDSALDAIVTIDERGIIVQLNPALERIFGFHADEMLGHNISMLMPEPDASRHDGYLSAYLDGGPPRIIGIGRQVTARRKDGTTFAAELAVTEFVSDGKRLFTGTLRDITARKSAELTAQRQTASLKALNEIAAHAELDPAAQLRRALQLGAHHFGLEIGIISRIEGSRYTVQHHITPSDMELRYGQEFELGQTYCDLTVQQMDVFAVDEMCRSAHAKHPCYQAFNLETYIGAPFHIQGQFYGTVNFSSPARYARHFDEGDREFIRMLARWCGAVLERAAMYEELRRNEERLQRSQNFANIGTWDWNIQTGELYWSERIGPLFGHPVGEIETTYDNFLDAIHPEDRPRVIEAVDACIRDGVEYNIEHRVVWPDGSLHWLSEKGDVVRNDEGKPLQMLGVVQDVTERRRYQDELARFRQVVDSTNQGISIATLEGTLTYLNQAHRNLLHDPDGTALGRNWGCLVPENAIELLAEIGTALDRGQGWKGLLPMKALDGKEFMSHSSIDLVLDEHGEAQLVFNIFYDYSEELRRQRELQEAREQAERANRAKSTFLSSMSHELRTPLNSILGFAQLLQKNAKEPLSERQHKHVGHILQSGRHLLELITEVLDLAKIEAGRLSVSIESVNCQEVLTECVNLVAALAAQRDIHLDGPHGTQPSPRIQADRTRLRQVVLNLLSNAIKYNYENGEVALGWEAQSGTVRIYVKDNGPGIPVEYHHQLFQPFNRLNAEQSGIEGTGVGLALTKQLVELMHGEIGVLSAAGQGATFWAELPAAESAIEITDIPRQDNERFLENTNMSTKLILYVEDNPVNLTLMEELVRYETGYELLSATNAEKGLSLAETRRPDLIILDINLPGMSGLEAITRLKTNAGTYDIPVIALSADAMQGTIDKAMAAGFQDYLTKPMDIAQIIEILHKFLEPISDA